MKKIIAILLALALACSLFGCGKTASNPASETVAPSNTEAADFPQEAQATPLLYKVTSAEGQEMYLMGTIHVGDDKTGFLPDEVYAAFEASDALAVERDIILLEKQMQTDRTVISQVNNLMNNPDGSTIKSQMDPALYDVAVEWMKAAGCYNIGMEYVRPLVWKDVISSYYQTQGSLCAEKGMEMRLQLLAEEQNKKLLEVESRLLQYEMYASFSADLQIMLLEDLVKVTPAEYCDAAQALYDLWCAGDESAIRAYLEEETDDMTEEEKALYEEYNNAIIIERNEAMLDVAISYLESDETVFYAVGTAHLFQYNGLVDTLREAGYTVEQVIYN